MGHLHDRHQRRYLWPSCAIILTVASLSYVAAPLGRAGMIPLLWLIVVPLTYVILGEDGSTKAKTPELPGVPIGSLWQPSVPRTRLRRHSGPRPRLALGLRSTLERFGYTQSLEPGKDVDLFLRSSDGKAIVARIHSERVGILACQDIMRAMLERGAEEAVLVAPLGSSSAAKRFAKRLRHRGLRIRIWRSPNPTPQTGETSRRHPRGERNKE